MSRVMSPADIARLRQLGSPRVSPDGTTVAFTVTDPDLAANRYARRIWLAPAGGTARARGRSPGPGRRCCRGGRPTASGWHSRRSRTTAARRSACCPSPTAASGWSWPRRRPVTELEWSPDGTALAFAARDPDPAEYGSGSEKPRDKDMPPRRITRLLYRLNAAGWTADRPGRVFVVAADGSAPPRAVSPGPFEAAGLAWSPDGQSLAFASGGTRTGTWTWPGTCSRSRPTAAASRSKSLAAPRPARCRRGLPTVNGWPATSTRRRCRARATASSWSLMSRPERPGC